MLHMARKFLLKDKTDTLIMKTDVKTREIVLKPEAHQKVIDFFKRDGVKFR